MTTTFDVTDFAVDRQQPRSGSLPSLRDLWWNVMRRRQERRAIVRLSRLAPHVIRDMGFDPDRIYEALDGSWDEVNPGQFRHR